MEFNLDGDLSIGKQGVLYLGGVAIEDPSLSLINILSIFERPTAEAPFIANLSLGFRVFGTNDTVDGPSMSFRFDQASLLFDGSEQQPLFSLDRAGFCYEPGETPSEPAQPNQDQNPFGDTLPFYLDKFCLSFDNIIDEPIPLLGNPAENLKGAFDVTSMTATLSGGLEIPREQPVISGEVKDLEVNFTDAGLKVSGLDGIGLGVDLSEFLGEDFPFAGRLFISGFSNFPSGDLLFSGRLKGKITNGGVDAIVAFSLEEGPIGICFGLDGGAVAIPLGPVAISGAKGGIAFGAGVNDPCAFKTALGLNDEGRVIGDPGTFIIDDTEICSPMNWEDFLSLKNSSGSSSALTPPSFVNQQISVTQALMDEGVEFEDAVAIVDTYETPEELSELSAAMAVSSEDGGIESLCPDEDSCPPASIGILAQQHPDFDVSGSVHEGRIIFKFTSIDEGLLNTLGVHMDLVRSFIDAVVPDGLIPSEEDRAAIIDDIALEVSAALRNEMD